MSTARNSEPVACGRNMSHGIGIARSVAVDPQMCATEVKVLPIMPRRHPANVAGAAPCQRDRCADTRRVAMRDGGQPWSRGPLESDHPYRRRTLGPGGKK